MIRLLALALASSLGASSLSSLPGSSRPVEDTVAESFHVTDHGRFDSGWSMEFLPGTDALAVAERGGQITLLRPGAPAAAVSGVPEVHPGPEAGLHEIIPGPSFSQDGTVYLSWIRPTATGGQGVVGRGRLDVEEGTLEDLEVIWTQDPGQGNSHYALRMFIQDGRLFVTSGDRMRPEAAQDVDTNLGKVLRLNLDGSPAQGNPFQERGGRAAEVWTLGHRNVLGIGEDSEGRIWVSEMGPTGGDELNLLTPGGNYGWPEASMGVAMDGSSIADHAPGDGFVAPVRHWTPAVSPGSLAIYQGDLFAGWEDSALLGALSGQALIRVPLDGGPAERWDAGARVRETEVAPDGAIWLLEDGDGGRLLELRPRPRPR